MKTVIQRTLLLSACLLGTVAIVGCTAGPGMFRSNPRGSHSCGDPGCTDPGCLGNLSEFAGASDPGCATGSCPPAGGVHEVYSQPTGSVVTTPLFTDDGWGDGCAPDVGLSGGATCVAPAPGFAPAHGGLGAGLASNSFGSGSSCGPGCHGGCNGRGCLSGGGFGAGGFGGGGGVQQAGYRGPSNLPRELDKTTLPRHVIEPPDILLIEAVDNLRLPSSRLQAGDSLIVQVGQTVPVDPTEGQVEQLFKVINGGYTVGVDGYIDLGPEYGKVLMEGLTLDEARVRMDKHLRRTLKSPKVYITFVNARTKQMISGQHLVRPDGTVSLGIYGSVLVTGLTIEEAQHRVQTHLSRHIHRPQVSIDILAYNSKFYYVIADGGGAGEQVIKLPCTGNETVLDAIANINGLPTVASKSEIWIARPSPAGTGIGQRLPIRWNEIVRDGATDTNYQLLPGDKLYVKADDLILFDTWVAKITAPWERIFGFTILGNATVRALQSGAGAQGGGIGF